MSLQSSCPEAKKALRLIQMLLLETKGFDESFRVVPRVDHVVNDSSKPLVFQQQHLNQLRAFLALGSWTAAMSRR